MSSPLLPFGRRELRLEPVHLGRGGGVELFERGLRLLLLEAASYSRTAPASAPSRVPGLRRELFELLAALRLEPVGLRLKVGSSADPPPTRSAC
jgi:hypothetical protein